MKPPIAATLALLLASSCLAPVASAHEYTKEDGTAITGMGYRAWAIAHNQAAPSDPVPPCLNPKAYDGTMPVEWFCTPEEQRLLEYVPAPQPDATAGCGVWAMNQAFATAANGGKVPPGALEALIHLCQDTGGPGTVVMPAYQPPPPIYQPPTSINCTTSQPVNRYDTIRTTCY